MSATATEGGNAQLITNFHQTSEITTQHFYYHCIHQPRSIMNATEQATLTSSIDLQEKLEKLIICQYKTRTFAAVRLTKAS